MSFGMDVGMGWEVGVCFGCKMGMDGNFGEGGLLGVLSLQVHIVEEGGKDGLCISTYWWSSLTRGCVQLVCFVILWSVPSGQQ